MELRQIILTLEKGSAKVPADTPFAMLVVTQFDGDECEIYGQMLKPLAVTPQNVL